MNNISVNVADGEYVGWEQITVTRVVDQTSSTFSLVVSDANPLSKKAKEITPGTTVKIEYGGAAVITGYVDTTTVEYSADSHYVTIEGRSKNKDIVDSSVIVDHLSEIKNKNIHDIAAKLCGPFGISVKLADDITDLKIYPSFKPNLGETVHEAIDRLANDSQVVISDLTDGNIMINRIGTKKTANRIINNGSTQTKILSCRATTDESNKYQKVKVLGQHRSDDDNFGKKQTKIASSDIEDSSVKRFRYKLIPAEHEMTQGDVEKQAVWFQQGYAGKGIKCEYSLQGWTGNAGELWTENKMVSIEDDIIQLPMGIELLVAQVTYNASNSGTTVTLQLESPGAYAPDKPASSSSGSGDNSKKTKKVNTSKGTKSAEKSSVDFWKPGDKI